MCLQMVDVFPIVDYPDYLDKSLFLRARENVL